MEPLVVTITIGEGSAMDIQNNRPVSEETMLSVLRWAADHFERLLLMKALGELLDERIVRRMLGNTP